MTKVSIINESIKDVDFLKNKLEERDACVQLYDKLDQLSVNNTCTLICHSDALKNYGDDNKNLLSLARNLKIKKIILIESYSDKFQLIKELGNSLIKLNLIESDTYSLEMNDKESTLNISNFQNYLFLNSSDTVLKSIDKVKDFVGESIPVIDEKGFILGIISESDLFNSLLMAEKKRNEEELS